MARVNVDTKAAYDHRFSILEKILGLHDGQGLGKCVKIWAICTDQETNHLSETEIDIISGIDGFGRAMLQSGLAKKPPGRNKKLYISGTKGRIEWIKELRLKTQKAGKQRALKAKRDSSGKFIESKQDHEIIEKACQHNSSMLTSAPAPAPAPAPALKEKNKKKEKSEHLRVAGSDVRSSGAQPHVVVIEYLNEKAGTKFQPETWRTKLNTALRAWGFSVDDLKRVVDNKTQDPYFQENKKYLRPQTLFGSKQKIEQYLSEPPKEDFKARVLRSLRAKGYE